MYRDQPSHRDEDAKHSAIAHLHRLQRDLTIASIDEAIRLIESDKFERLTEEHVRRVANYQPIEIDEEAFFDKAFSTGKEVAASLAFAEHVGRQVVLDDLLRLQATLAGRLPEPRCSTRERDSS